MSFWAGVIVGVVAVPGAYLLLLVVARCYFRLNLFAHLGVYSAYLLDEQNGGGRFDLDTGWNLKTWAKYFHAGQWPHTRSRWIAVGKPRADGNGLGFTIGRSKGRQ